MEKQSKVEKRGVEKRFGSRIPAMLLAAVILITSVGAGLAGALHFTADLFWSEGGERKGFMR